MYKKFSLNNHTTAFPLGKAIHAIGCYGCVTDVTSHTSFDNCIIGVMVHASQGFSDILSGFTPGSESVTQICNRFIRGSVLRAVSRRTISPGKKALIE